ncbi:uncharacterized protein LOC132564497 [Ylistrum balloti]|uniref:uncharacterized protein LOC132564497 n=1 Tax=Ylistrum balloti TaxID=509963 RepID=UPI002905884F|nr:uncharacterized protein LOC132564497 [Ylistrum balloti]
MDDKYGVEMFQIDDRIQDPVERAKFEEFKKDHLDEFWNAFNIFDTNKDGRICLDELGRVMQGCGQNPTDEDVKDAMGKLDKNNDGMVEFAEFVYHMYYIYKNPITMAESLSEAFKVFDRDGNGWIDAKELENIVKMLGEDPLKETDVNDMMKIADTNNDGKIDYDEPFKKAFRQKQIIKNVCMNG